VTSHSALTPRYWKRNCAHVPDTPQRTAANSASAMPRARKPVLGFSERMAEVTYIYPMRFPWEAVYVLVGILAFFFGSLLFTGALTGFRSSGYRDISIRKREASLRVLKQAYSADSARTDSTGRVRAASELMELLRVEYLNDSATKNANYGIFLEKDSLRRLIDRVGGMQRPDSIPFVYKLPSTADSTKSFYIFGKASILWRDTSYSPIDYIRKYPATGFWIFISILQIVLWVLVIPLCIQISRQMTDKLRGDGIVIKRKNVILLGVATVAAIGLFLVTLYGRLYAGGLIDSDYYMQGFGGVMLICVILGNSAAACCLFGFLLTARAMGIVLQRFSATTAESCVRDYKELRRSFNAFFFVAATILSLLVVWLGSLFSAINSIDLFRFYQAQTGAPFLVYDFVYLLAGFYTVLLLLFYLPVRVNMLALVSSMPDQGPADGAPARLLESLMGRFVGILAASSPILVALLQQFFQNLSH